MSVRSATRCMDYHLHQIILVILADTPALPYSHSDYFDSYRSLHALIELNKQSLSDVSIFCNDDVIVENILTECPNITHLRWTFESEENTELTEFERIARYLITLRLKHLIVIIPRLPTLLPVTFLMILSCSPQLENFTCNMGARMFLPTAIKSIEYFKRWLKTARDCAD